MDAVDPGYPKVAVDREDLRGAVDPEHGTQTVELAPPDAAAAVALWETCGLTRPWNDAHADFTRALGGPSSAVLGIWEADILVGAAMVGHDGHRGWVYYLAVAASVQGSGRGRTLMDACERWLVARGVPKIQFMVRWTMPTSWPSTTTSATSPRTWWSWAVASPDPHPITDRATYLFGENRVFAEYLHRSMVEPEVGRQIGTVGHGDRGAGLGGGIGGQVLSDCCPLNPEAG